MLAITFLLIGCVAACMVFLGISIVQAGKFAKECEEHAEKCLREHDSERWRGY